MYEEVVTNGLEAGHADARRIERAVEDGLLDVLPADETPVLVRLRQNEHLSEADAEVLALAADHAGTAVMDEQFGRTVADAEGIDTRGTAYLVLSLLRDGILEADEARKTIGEMVDVGWYCSPPLYAKLVRRIEQLG